VNSKPLAPPKHAEGPYLITAASPMMADIKSIERPSVIAPKHEAPQEPAPLRMPLIAD